MDRDAADWTFGVSWAHPTELSIVPRAAHPPWFGSCSRLSHAVGALLTNLLASHAEVAAQHLQRGDFTESQSERASLAAARLAEGRLRLLSPADGVWVHPDGEGVADFRSLMRSGRRIADLVGVDDLDLLLGGHWVESLHTPESWARQKQFSLVVTVPAEDVPDVDPCHPQLRRHADVVIRLVLHGQFDLTDPRSGRRGGSRRAAEP